MDITLDKKNSTEGVIKVKLNHTDYQPQVDEKVKDYAKKANMKGFRPGKVPTGLIKKMYGKSIMVEEVNNVLSKSLQKYIEENNIQLVGEPLPDEDKAKAIDWDSQKDFEFDYEIGMVNAFDYDLSAKTKVKSYTIELDKKGLNETLEGIKKQFGDVTNPEVSEAGDDFYGIFEQKDGDITSESGLKWDQIVKKRQKMFIGVKPDDSIEINIESLVNDKHDLMNLLDIGHDVAHDLKGTFTFTIKNINRTVPAEMNQELFDKVFGKDSVKNEDEFVDRVKKTVEDNYKRESDLLLGRDVRDAIIKKTNIEIPTEFLKKWLLKANEGNVTMEDIEKEFDEYTTSLKWDLIRNKIANDHELKIDFEEIKNRTKLMILSQLGGPGAADQLKDHMDSFADNYLQAENGENYRKVHNEIKEEKIITLAKSKLSIVEKKVDLDGFKKVASN